MAENTPTSLNCPACGAPLDIDGTSAVVRCKFCGNVSLLPGILPDQAAAPASALDEIRKLAGRREPGRCDPQRYQEAYGVDLSEAKNALEALQAGRLVTPSEPGMHSSEELTKALQEVQRLLRHGNKIGAIKVYRENYDVSLARGQVRHRADRSRATPSTRNGFPDAACLTCHTGEARPKSGRAPGQKALGARLQRYGGDPAVSSAASSASALSAARRPILPHYYPNGPVIPDPCRRRRRPEFRRRAL